MARVGRAALSVVVVLMATLTFAAAARAQESVTVDFSYSPAAPKAGETVTFTSTSSSQAAIVRERWDFNSDGQFDADGRTATPFFIAAATYSVTLEVQNDIGEVRRASKLVTVSPLSTTPPQPAVLPPAPPLPPPAPLPRPTGSGVGAVTPVTITPFPIVRIAGDYATAGLRLRLVAVTAPVGVTITVRCRGRGCPYRRSGPFVVRRPGTRPVGAARYVRIRGFRGRLLKPGARLQVLVAHPRQIGKYTRFTIRRGAPQRVDGCLRPSGSITTCG